MVGTQYIRMYLGIDQLVIQRSRGYEIVDTPAGILLACLEAIRPPRIDILLLGIEITEGIGETSL